MPPLYRFTAMALNEGKNAARSSEFIRSGW
jgi:hypothetical protein